MHKQPVKALLDVKDRIAGLIRRARRYSPRPNFSLSDEWTFPVGLIIVILSLVSGFASYLILNGLTPINPTNDVVVTLFFVNVALIAALVAVVAYQIFDLWRARKRQAAGAGLHVRILGLFSLVAIIPAIILATFATVSLDRVLDQLFSARIKSIVQNSLDVASSYVREHGEVIRIELLAMADQLDSSAKLLEENPAAFQKLFDAQATIHNLGVAYLITEEGRVITQTGDATAFAQGAPPKQAFDLARSGRVAILPPEYTGGIGALKKLENPAGTFLYVIRPVNQEVIRQLQKAKANIVQYAQLEQRRSAMKLVFIIMYVTITFTLLLTVIWFGLWFAKWLVAPIRKLIGAAQQVSEGNLDVKVDALPKQGDVGQLGVTFNKMTADLRKQRQQLMSANAELDERRRFIEAVLSGVTAGVLGIHNSGKITLANTSAMALLGVKEKDLIGRRLEEAVPEFGPLLPEAQKQSKKPLQQQITIIRDGTERNFSVRVTHEREDKKDYGLVITFDDISELVVAQRTSAWSDVARRLAHEIKNPLTPIQLSAERIRRKYGDAITTDREIFDRCTDTIIRHVGDIGRMVDEFSAFARMPKPVIESHDVGELVREAVILFQMSHPEIKYVLDLPQEPIIAECDRRLITQAITNLVKNAGEAIAAVQNNSEDPYAGIIIARVKEQGARVVLEVVDNGCGLPKENRHRLIEPYITTRQKGTGLGLAIVQRITEQHGGALELEDAVQEDGTVQGAVVRISLPLNRPAGSQEEAPPEPAKTKRRPSNSSGKRQAKRRKEGVTYGV